VVYIDFRYDIEEVEDTDRKAGQPGRRCHTGFLVKVNGVPDLLLSLLFSEAGDGNGNKQERDYVAVPPARP